MVNKRNQESSLSNKQSQHLKVKKAYSFFSCFTTLSKEDIIHGSIIFLLCALQSELQFSP